LLRSHVDFGTLPGICFARGMTAFLFERKIRIFDYPKFAEPYRNRIRENAARLAAEAGLEIDFIRFLKGLLPDQYKGLRCQLTRTEGSTFVPNAWRRATGQSYGGSAEPDGFGQRTPPIKLYPTEDVAYFGACPERARCGAEKSSSAAAYRHFV
jgi:hypothetical protein